MTNDLPTSTTSYAELWRLYSTGTESQKREAGSLLAERRQHEREKFDPTETIFEKRKLTKKED